MWKNSLKIWESENVEVTLIIRKNINIGKILGLFIKSMGNVKCMKMLGFVVKFEEEIWKCENSEI